MRQGRYATGKVAAAKTGPNDASGVVWATVSVFSFDFLILTDVVMLFSVYDIGMLSYKFQLLILITIYRYE